MEGAVKVPSPVVPLAGSGASHSCWYCGRANGDTHPLIVYAVAGDQRHDLKLLRCRRCAFAHELEEGMASVALGFAGFATAGVLFVRGIHPASGFGAALVRMVPFAGLAFVLAVIGFLLGIPLGKPSLWGTRPKSDWEQHPEVQRYRTEGWEVFHIEMVSSINE